VHTETVAIAACPMSSELGAQAFGPPAELVRAMRVHEVRILIGYRRSP